MQIQPLSQEDSPGEENGKLTVMFFPGESHGQRSLLGYSPCLAIKPPLPYFFHFINISSSTINCFPAQAMLCPDLGHFPRGSEECWEQMLRRISIISWDICYMLRFPGKGRLFFIRDWKKKWKSLCRVWLFVTPWTVARQAHPWNSPGKNIGVGCHFLLRGSSRPRGQAQVSHIVGRFFTDWATREATWW